MTTGFSAATTLLTGLVVSSSPATVFTPSEDGLYLISAYGEDFPSAPLPFSFIEYSTVDDSGSQTFQIGSMISGTSISLSPMLFRLIAGNSFAVSFPGDSTQDMTGTLGFSIVKVG